MSGGLSQLAARSRLQHQEEVKKRIQTSQIVNRLNAQALDKIKMTPMAVKAAEILLRKTIPDLKAIEHTGDIDMSLRVEGIKRVVIKPK
jgi:hypothetical protein